MINQKVQSKNGRGQNEPLMGYEGIIVQEDDSKCCSCTPSWVKTFLIFFTAIILMIALTLVGLGVYLLVIRLPFIPVLVGEIAYLSHFLLFVVGVLLIIACIIGFVGVANGKSHLLLTFAWMLFVILLIQLGTGIISLCFSNVFYDWCASRLAYTMKTYYSTEATDINSNVDQLQQKFKCCGSYSWRDWKESVFENHSEHKALKPYFEYSEKVPDSCCIRVVEGCGMLPHPSNIYYNGCMESAFINLREHYYIICVVALALITVEFFGVILAFCYSKAPKKTR